MTILDQVRYTDMDDEILDFFRAISVDVIHMDLRGPRAASSQKVGADGKDPMRHNTSHANTELAQDLKAGKDCTEIFEQARQKVESHGLKLYNVHLPCWEEIALGKEDRDDKIDAWSKMLESLGKAGISHLSWCFKPMGNFRTQAVIGRGQAQYSTFDYGEFLENRPEPYDPPVSEEEMWFHMENFLKAVIPVAEKAGVRMALHPDDPPMSEPLGGIAQICAQLEDFRRIFFDIAESENNRMLFCQGCMTELLGDGVYDAISEMASRDKIAWVHFRNVRGQLPKFSEVFIDEGDNDMRRAMEIYRDNGFNGPFAMDHSPRFPHSNRVGKAFANGYIRSLIQQVYG